jgi:hypothetical protein
MPPAVEVVGYKGAKMKKNTVSLISGDRTELVRLRTLYEHHAALAQTFQAQIHALVSRYGMDLEREDWELDTNQGVIRRVQPTPQVARIIHTD